MPDISLLEPRVMNGVIERMPPADGMLGHTLVPRSSWPDTYWEYDIVTRRRHIARPTTPNSPATIIDQNGIGKMRGSFVYTREKKVFSPTVIRWLREPGQLARPNAEAAVLREFQELRDRIFRWEEFLIWKMLAVTEFNLASLGQNIAINYNVAASHKPTVSTYWTDPTANLVTDFQDFKRIISRDSDSRLTRLIGNGPTVETFYRHMQVQAMLSDDQKRVMVTEGKLPVFQGVSMMEYDRGYVDDFTNPSTPTFVTYIPDGYLVGIAEGGPQTFAYLDGPAADDEAPIGHTGAFAKTWKEKDPSARQVLIESNGFPVLYQPDALIIPRVF